MDIRRANKKDKKAVFVLAEKLATSFVVSKDDFSHSYDSLLIEMAANRALILVGLVNKKVASYALGYIHFSFYANGKISWLEELYVDEPMRNSGLGKKLVQEFEVNMKKQGAKLNALATRRSAGFYLHCQYEESAIYFRKQLE
jgi:N-acetylglutamate synthase-like GNAT family acetyltransferase